MKRSVWSKRKRYNLQYPQQLTEVSEDEWPDLGWDPKPVQVWVSRKFLVQVFEVDNPAYPGLLRLSICRIKRGRHGWVDGLTWDQLQDIKRQVGLGECYAIEVYPRDGDVINVANFRHLWVFEEPLPVGWFQD